MSHHRTNRTNRSIRARRLAVALVAFGATSVAGAGAASAAEPWPVFLPPDPSTICPSCALPTTTTTALDFGTPDLTGHIDPSRLPLLTTTTLVFRPPTVGRIDPGRVPVRVNPGSGVTTPAPTPGSSPSTGAPVRATPAASKPAASRPATAPRPSDVDESAASEPVNLDIVADLPTEDVSALTDTSAAPTTMVSHSTEHADAATRAPHGATQSPLPIVLAATLGALVVAAAGALWMVLRRRRLA